MFIYRPCLEGARVLNTCNKSGEIIPLSSLLFSARPGIKIAAYLSGRSFSACYQVCLEPDRRIQPPFYAVNMCTLEGCILALISLCNYIPRYEKYISRFSLSYPFN